MIEDPKIHELNYKYYDHVPEGFRLATLTDLEKGLFKHNTGYLVKSSLVEEYYPRRVKIIFSESDITFLKVGMVWIYKS